MKVQLFVYGILVIRKSVRSYRKTLMDEKKKMETSKAALEKELADLKETLSASEQVPLRVPLIPFRQFIFSFTYNKISCGQTIPKKPFEYFHSISLTDFNIQSCHPFVARPDPWGLGWDLAREGSPHPQTLHSSIYFYVPRVGSPASSVSLPQTISQSAHFKSGSFASEFGSQLSLASFQFPTFSCIFWE